METRGGGDFREQVQHNTLCIVLLFNLFSPHNHTFALVFHVLHLQIKNVLHVCTCALEG
jgi:hypothetical protein